MVKKHSPASAPHKCPACKIKFRGIAEFCPNCSYPFHAEMEVKKAYIIAEKERTRQENKALGKTYPASVAGFVFGLYCLIAATMGGAAQGQMAVGVTFIILGLFWLASAFWIQKRPFYGSLVSLIILVANVGITIVGFSIGQTLISVIGIPFLAIVTAALVLSILAGKKLRTLKHEHEEARRMAELNKA